MKVFRVSFEDPRDGHKGYEFARNISYARKLKKWNTSRGLVAEIEPLAVTLTKAGVLNFLNRYAGHPNNG